MVQVAQTDTDAFVDDLIAKQKTITANRQAMAREIVDGQRLGNLDEAKRFAAAWIETAAQHATNEDYCRERYEKAEAELARVQRDHDTMLENLTHAQERGTVALDMARASKRLANVSPGLLHVLGHVAHRRDLIDQKHGPIDAKTLAIQNGTGVSKGQSQDATMARRVCDDAFAAGNGTMAHILTEEVAEAIAESDPKHLRDELLDVAAFACKWIEAIDIKAKGTTPFTPIEST